MPFFSKAKAPAAEAPPPPPPPRPLHVGVPLAACSVAVDPVQGTVAVGSVDGLVKLFGFQGAEIALWPDNTGGDADPSSGRSPVAHLAFATNSGRLLAVHAPGTLRLWALDGRARLAHTATIDEGAVALVAPCPGTAWMLLGTEHGGACARRGGRRRARAVAAVPPPAADDGAAGEAVRARGEPARPAPPPAACAAARPRARPSAGWRRDRGVQAWRHGGGGAPAGGDGGGDDGGGGAAAAGLSCAAWSPSLAYKQVVAGYDDGTLVVYSLRNPNAPNATLAVNPYATARAARCERCGGRRRRRPSGGGARPALFVVGGTAREQDPDGLVVLKGEGLKERAMVAPPDGTVLGFGLAGGAELLPNGAPALASTVVVLTSAAELLRYDAERSARAVGGAARPRDGDGQRTGRSCACRSRRRRRRAEAAARAVGVVTPHAPPDDAASAAAAPAAAAPPRESAAARLRRETEAAAAAARRRGVGGRRASRARVGGARLRAKHEAAAAGDAAASSSSPPRRKPTRSLTVHSRARLRAPGGTASRLRSQGSSFAAAPAPDSSARASAGLARRRPLFLAKEMSDDAARRRARRPARRLLPAGWRRRRRLVGGGAALGAFAGGRRRRGAREREGGGKAAEVRGRAAAAGSAIEESLHAARERGEKLGELGEKTQQLSDDAADFASLAKQLRQQQERPFFGLF